MQYQDFRNNRLTKYLLGVPTTNNWNILLIIGMHMKPRSINNLKKEKHVYNGHIGLAKLTF